MATILGWAEAPGKLILCGEHAVVYGQPGLAMAVRRRAQAELFRGETHGLILAVDVLGKRLACPAEEAIALPRTLEARHRRFLAGDLAIGDVLPDIYALMTYALAISLEAGGRTTMPDLLLEVRLDIPLGCGMGSSAAVGLAVIAATRSWLGLDCSPDELLKPSLACERLQHGNPSGIDSYVCAHGGAVRFTRDERRGIDLNPPPLVLINTGPPEATTGECVEAVRQLGKPDSFWRQFTEVADWFEEALRGGDDIRLCQAMHANHRLLVELGVVPAKVMRFIADIEAAGCAAKVSGAGSIRGDNAGIVVALDDPDVRELAAARGYGIIPVEGAPHGTQVVAGVGPR